MPKKRSAFAWFFIIIGKSVFDLFKHIFLLLFAVIKFIFRIISSIFRKKQNIGKKKSAGEKEVFKKKNKPGAFSFLFSKKKNAKESISGIYHERTARGNYLDFRKRLDSESLIISIVGKRGSGKSALGFSLMENIYSSAGRKAYVMGVEQKLVPKWIDSVDDIEEVENGGLLLIDEGAISFSSRDSMSKKNKELGKLLAVARHKDLTLIFITQNTGMIDKNVLNLTDTLIFKEGSLLQERMERPAMKDFYEKSGKSLESVPKDSRKAYAYVFDDDFEGLIKAGLPSFWSEKVSKSRNK